MRILGNRNNGREFGKECFTEYEIQQILANDYMSNPKYVILNLKVFNWESDFLACTRHGYWHEVEIKISVADFKRDKKKVKKRNVFNAGMPKEVYRDWSNILPNYFSYCVPYFIADKVRDLVPDYAGLIMINKYGRLEYIKGARQLHTVKLDENMMRLKEKFYYAYRTWYDRYKQFHDREVELRSEVSFLKAEYKVATGYDISEVL